MLGARRGITAAEDLISRPKPSDRVPHGVIDGNYSAVRDIIWRRSSAIVWLDYSFARVFSQALRRTARRIITRERLYAGSNREIVRNALFDTDGIPWWVI